MNSGVYKLTFSSGRFYVGKSIDIPTRWQQHEDKFSKHKAAQRMQQEFNLCGSPRKEVLFSCHADHIDIVETWLIATHQRDYGNLMLNATYPEPLPDSEYEKINRAPYLLKQSTADHIDKICDLETALDTIDEEQETLIVRLTEEKSVAQQKLAHLRSCGFLTTEDVELLRERHAFLELDYAELEQKFNAQQQQLKELQAYNARPWWQRLFS